jgi:hypothetical protein
MRDRNDGRSLKQAHLLHATCRLFFGSIQSQPVNVALPWEVGGWDCGPAAQSLAACQAGHDGAAVYPTRFRIDLAGSPYRAETDPRRSPENRTTAPGCAAWQAISSVSNAHVVLRQEGSDAARRPLALTLPDGMVAAEHSAHRESTTFP